MKIRDKAHRVELFMAKVAIGHGGGCWFWLGDKDERLGYGRCSRYGRKIMAHRESYSLFIGPVPPGLELDHLCKNRACVRPDHMEPVTHAENILRGDTFQARNAAKSACDNGHPFDSSNTAIRVRRSRGGRTSRICRTCERQRGRKYYARNRGASV